MKRLVAIILVLTLAFGLYLSRGDIKNAIEGRGVESGHVNCNRLGRSHNIDDVVLTVGGEDVLWGEYWYWLKGNIESVEKYHATFNTDINWETYAPYVVDYTDSTLAEIYAVLAFAREKGIVLNEENQRLFSQSKLGLIQQILGEGATEADFAEYLSENNMSGAAVDNLLSAQLLLGQGLEDAYGADGEKLSEEEILSYFDNNGYMYANHILILTDSESGKEEKALAQSIYDELAAIEDNDALVEAFLELKAEHDEDSGGSMYPDGYVFTSGEMVAEFEEAVKGLKDFEVSGPVKTNFGYHIIIRLPIKADTVVAYDNYYNPVSASYTVANALYSEELAAVMAAAQPEFTALHDVLDVLQYVKR